MPEVTDWTNNVPTTDKRPDDKTDKKLETKHTDAMHNTAELLGKRLSDTGIPPPGARAMRSMLSRVKPYSFQIRHQLQKKQLLKISCLELQDHCLSIVRQQLCKDPP